MKPITPKGRADILTDLQAGQLSMTAIARNNGVGTSTVSRIARAEGLSTVGTVQAEKAARAKQARMADRRAQLVSDLIDDAIGLREQIFQPREYVFASAGKLLRRTLPTPTPGDIRALITSCAICIDKSLALDAATRDDLFLSDFDEWLAEMSGAHDRPDQDLLEPQTKESQP